MRRFYNSVCGILMAVCCITVAMAQPAAKTNTAVPRLVKFSGTLTDGGGQPLSGVVGVTFALYDEQEGGAPVWMETQNVQADASGAYTALLGATKNDGVPAEVFGAGQRWLGVQAQGEAERPRVLMTSVPYSLKAVDAETLGGLPASAFALAGTATGTAGHAGVEAPKASGKPAAAPALSGTGTAGTVPLWTDSDTLGNSAILQSGGNVGIGTVSPSAQFSVETAVSVGIGGATSSSSGVGVSGRVTATSGSGIGVLGASTSNSGFGVQGEVTAGSGKTVGVEGLSKSTSGFGIQGSATATEGTTVGVSGTSSSTGGTGVAGGASATTGRTYGVQGSAASSQGVGVDGIGITLSTLGGQLSLGGVGVWGDTHDGSVGVLGTADDAQAMAAYNNANNTATLFVENQENNINTGIVFATNSAFGGFCNIFVSGNLNCSGSVGGHAVLPDGAGGSRDVALYAVQAPENWFEDIGSGQLQNGAAVVALDPEYVQTVNTGMDYHVFLTPKGDCKGLYVANETAGSFEVHELGGGNSSIGFDYRIVAKRKGFENIRMAEVAGPQKGSNLKSGGGIRPAGAIAVKPFAPR
jgi:hypothetical protein